MPSKLTRHTASVEADLLHPVADQLTERALDEHLARQKSVARLQLIWEQRAFLARVAACALVLSAVAAFLIPKRYESKAQLAPPDSSQSSLGSMASAAAMLGNLAGKMGGLTSLAENALGIKSSGALFVAVLKSETVQDALVHKFELEKRYHVRYIEDARKQLARHTDLAEDRESGVVSITVTDHDPANAAAMTQEYINQLNIVVSQISTSSARRERIFLEGRLNQVKQDLEDAEKQFSQFSSQKTVINLEAQGKAIVESGAILQGQMIAAQSELEGMRQIYSDQNVRVRSLQARVNELQNALQKLGGKSATENSTADQLYPSLRQLPLLGVDYADLFRRVKVEEAIFEILTKEYELARVQEAREIPTVKVLDPPLVPEKKSFPPRLVIILLSTTVALLMAIVWLRSRSAWDAVDASDPRKEFATEVFRDVRAQMPMFSKNGSHREQPAWLRASLHRFKVNGKGQEENGE